MHRKGPVEILLPTLVYALTGHLTEATARLPFALANLAGVVAIFVFGLAAVQLAGGWVAALFLALDDVYWLCADRAVSKRCDPDLGVGRVDPLPAAAKSCRLAPIFGLSCVFICRTGVFAYYEAALVVVPGLYLLWQIVMA